MSKQKTQERGTNMSEAKRATRNEKVIVNRDFSIVVPEGYLFSTDKNEINENRLFVFIKDEQNELFVENYGDDAEFSLAEPFSAPQCITVMTAQNLAEKMGGELDLSDENVRNAMSGFASNFLTMFGGEFVAVKEDDDILVYYSKKEDTNTFFAIVTSQNMYNGQIWINDVEDAAERDAIINAWLNGVDNYILTDADKVPVSPFVVPTYAEGKREQMGSITVAVPDHTTTLLSSAADRKNLGELFDLSNMLDEFAFLAINKDFKNGFHDYKNAGISIHAKNDGIQQIPELAAYWNDEMKSERKKVLLSLVENNFSDCPFKMHYKELEGNIAAIYIQARESTDNIEQWASYFVLFIHETTLVQVNIHINAILDRAVMDKAVENWIKTAKVASPEEIKEFEKNKAKRELGSFAAEDGQIDAVKTTLLFSKDVVFHNDDDMVFENGHHVTKMLQFNSAEIDNYPEVKDHAQTFGTQIKEVLAFVEQNEHLAIPKKLCHKNVYAATNKKQITGMTLFYLCAWHTITIGDNGNNVYMVIADSNLIKGIPEFYNLMAEFVKTLREFNGKTDEFKLMVSSAMVMDSPIEYIEKPVLGAQAPELGSIKSIGDNEHPYAGVCAKLQELKKMEKSAQKSLAKADEKKEWEIKVLPDATFGIYAYNGCETEITIPEEIDGLKVTRICEYAFSPLQDNISKDVVKQRESITEVHLPASIKVIEDNAFCSCPKLRTLVLNDGMEEIGSFAIAFTAINEIVFPESITHIGSRALSGCSELQNVVFPVGECQVDNGVLGGCEKIKTIITVNNGTVLYQYPDTLTDKEYAIPEGITSIADGAFSSVKLEVLTIANTVTSIGNNVFQGSALKQIIMPEEMVSVEANTFSDADNLSEMIYSKNGEVLYYCPNSINRKKIEVPEFVTTLAPGAFYDNESARDIYLSENVSDIGYCAFNTWKEGCKIQIHAPEQSYVEHYIEKEDEENLIFVANGVASVPYEAEEESNFDLSSLLGLFGLNN